MSIYNKISIPDIRQIFAGYPAKSVSGATLAIFMNGNGNQRGLNADIGLWPSFISHTEVSLQSTLIYA